jgi:hypothetical protein
MFVPVSGMVAAAVYVLRWSFDCHLRLTVLEEVG